MLKYCIPKTNYYCYFPDENLYKDFSNFVISISNENTPKFFKCISQVTYITDKDEQLNQISNYHEGKNNHRGIQETEQHMKRKYYWKTISKDIEQYINKCQTCKKQKYLRHRIKQPFQLTPTFNKPFQNIHIDIFEIDKQKFLTIIDVFSKFTQAYPLDSKNAIDILDQLVNFISIFGAPCTIVADNEFNVLPIKNLLEQHKIFVHFTTPYNHNSNSPVERVHSTLIEHYRLLKEQFPKESSIKLIRYSLIAYNNSIHSDLKYTPHEILYGHTETRNPFDIDFNKHFIETYVNDHQNKLHKLYEQLTENQTITKEKRNENINSKRNPHIFKLNDKVFIRNTRAPGNKSQQRFLGPFIITKITNHETCYLKPENSENIVKRHLNELLPFVDASSSVITSSPPTRK